jgi:hypothetical protein
MQVDYYFAVLIGTIHFQAVHDAAGWYSGHTIVGQRKRVHSFYGNINGSDEYIILTFPI